jgi:hypothetical protein
MRIDSPSYTRYNLRDIPIWEKKAKMTSIGKKNLKNPYPETVKRERGRRFPYNLRRDFIR